MGDIDGMFDALNTCPPINIGIISGFQPAGSDAPIPTVLAAVPLAPNAAAAAAAAAALKDEPGITPDMALLPDPGSVPGKVPGNVPGSPPGSVPSSAPGSVPANVPDKLPGIVPDKLPSIVLDKLPSIVPDNVPGIVLDNVPGSVPGTLSEPGIDKLDNG